MSARTDVRVIAIALSLVTVGVITAGCSSGPAADTPPTPIPASSSAAQTMTAQVACDKFFAFDLFRHSRLRADVDADSDQRKESLKDYRDLAASMATSLDSAVTVGDLPPRIKVNADRIVRQVSQVVKAGGDIRDATGAMDTKLGKSAARIEKACVTTGHPLPQENVDARESARDD